jgi:uncharacterized membrane protein
MVIQKLPVKPLKLCFEIGKGESRSFDILKERYAHGKIDKDAFDSKRKNLLG